MCINRVMARIRVLVRIRVMDRIKVRIRIRVGLARESGLGKFWHGGPSLLSAYAGSRVAS